MKALVCRALGNHESLAVEEIEDPVPGKGEVLIEVEAAGLNFPDLLLVDGKYQASPELPFTPGSECAGTVIELGGDVAGIAVGDRVMASMMLGAFAKKVTVPRAAVMKIPDSMSFAQAAGFTMTYATSYHALKQRAALTRDETLLVLGAAGGVGLTAVELGKLMGARVIAAASTPEKLAVAREMGAHAGIRYTEEKLKDRVKDLTDGRGADVIYDPVGGDFAEQALRASAWDGRYLVIGFASGEIPRIPLNLPLLKGCRIVGVFWGAWTKQDPEGHGENMRELLAHFEAGNLNPRVTQTHPLEAFREAFATLAERRAIGKVILKP